MNNVSEEQIAEYEANGAICVRGVLGQDWTEKLIRRIDQHAANVGQTETTEWSHLAFSDRYLYPTHAWMKEFLFESGVAELAGKLMRSDTARLYFDHIFVREGLSESTTPWHQDRPYWPFAGSQICSVWLTLTDCDVASSAMEIIKGSHDWGKVFKPTAFSEEDINAEWIQNAEGEDLPDFDTHRDDYDILAWEMKAGDAIVFSAEAIHGAGVNQTTDRRRVALSTRWLGDDAVWDPRPGVDPIITQEHVNIHPGEFAQDEAFPLVWQAPGTALSLET